MRYSGTKTQNGVTTSFNRNYPRDVVKNDLVQAAYEAYDGFASVRRINSTFPLNPQTTDVNDYPLSIRIETYYFSSYQGNTLGHVGFDSNGEISLDSPVYIPVSSTWNFRPLGAVLGVDGYTDSSPPQMFQWTGTYPINVYVSEWKFQSVGNQNRTGIHRALSQTMTSNQPLLAQRDSSANGAALLTFELGGKMCLHFGGGNRYMIDNNSFGNEPAHEWKEGDEPHLFATGVGRAGTFVTPVIAIGQAAGGSSNYVALGTNNSGKFWVYNNGATNSSQGGDAIGTGDVWHLNARFSQSGTQLSVNGARRIGHFYSNEGPSTAFNTTSTAYTGGSVIVGKYTATPPSYHDGYIAEVGFAKRHNPLATIVEQDSMKAFNATKYE